jgi:TRAP-type C4-dicarboxylate transport system substrate-binding protein
MTARSNQVDVRNPLVALPSAAAMQNLPPEAKAALRQLLKELGADCRERANESWRKHKAPMAAYWKANAVYARHIALLLRDV